MIQDSVLIYITAERGIGEPHADLCGKARAEQHQSVGMRQLRQTSGNFHRGIKIHKQTDIKYSFFRLDIYAVTAKSAEADARSRCMRQLTQLDGS